MLKRLFIFAFIFIIILTFLCQKRYLSNLQRQSKDREAQKINNLKGIIGEGKDFKIYFYNKNGSLQTFFSGHKIVYYTDATFSAEGELVYRSYNLRSETSLTIQTASATGIFEDLETQNNFLFSGHAQLKSLRLPEYVNFNFDGNQGCTKNVFINALEHTITSAERIHSSGPYGTISALGFFYDIDKKELKFDSQVTGVFKPQNSNH